jgi:hypothetical protein
MAQQDVQLLQQAEAELATAQRAIRQADAYYHLGITADVGPAVADYRQAGELLATQQYEQAIAAATAAERAARRAHDDAVRAARRKQGQIDRDRQWAERRQPPATRRRRSVFPRIPVPLPDLGGQRTRNRPVPTSPPRRSTSHQASQSDWSDASDGSDSASSGASQSSW